MTNSRNKGVKLAITGEDQAALRKCLLLMQAFRAIRRIMPLQQAYAFLFVALDEGRSVSEYARRAGTTQAVMTRILFALSSRARGRVPGYGLVQGAIDPDDSRRHQMFLTPKGEALVHELIRSVRYNRQPEMKRRLEMMPESPPRNLARDQWFFRLIAAGRKLDTDDVQLAARQVEALINHRKSKKSALRRHRA